MRIFLAICVTPLLANAKHLDIANNDDIFGGVPVELIRNHIIKSANLGSLLLLSMTSKNFHELAEEELFSRCSGDFCEVLTEQASYSKAGSGNVICLESFIRRAWPKSVDLISASVLDETLQDLWEISRGRFSQLQKRPFSHLSGFPQVTATVLKLKLPFSIEIDPYLLSEVPWKVISEYIDGVIDRIDNKEELGSMMSSIISKGDFGPVEAILNDESVVSRIEKFLPFSLDFLKQFVAFKSCNKTVEHFGIDQLPDLINSDIFDPVFFFYTDLPFETILDILGSPEDKELFIASLILGGYEPDLSWLGSPRLYGECMQSVKDCIETGTFSSLSYTSIIAAIVYAIMHGSIIGKPVREIQSKITTIIGDRGFKASDGLILLSQQFWKDSTNEEYNFFKNEAETSFSDTARYRNERMITMYEKGDLDRDTFTPILEKMIIGFFDGSSEAFNPELLERVLKFSEELDLLSVVALYKEGHDYLSSYMSKKSPAELVALVPIYEKPSDYNDLEFTLLKTLTMIEGGIQAFRATGTAASNLLFLLRQDMMGYTDEALRASLDKLDSNLAFFMDHFLFTDQASFRMHVASDWPNHRRLRLDIALTKATSLYPTSLQIESLKTIGIDKENLLSMYMVRALMSTPEGREMAQELVTEEDLEAAINICNSVAPYFH